ncbi:hypothetical protein VFPPC_11973 [Pochonia chlamydosporia 170]|uniref:Uncharacterized protein n=1 Tax=Pochonia chlamydosporia 170 TaxID=1380566 RepID=A0A179F1R8_METCM|nr:hypothetical protein VFPPC_11973 [Pochonia chlamydosporia 170]OAQ59053.2 hypothetical protein VFPPC_11973 [Pochonia chlamydosporia 170]
MEYLAPVPPMTTSQPTAGTPWGGLPVEIQLVIASMFIGDVILCKPREFGGGNCGDVRRKYAGLSRTWREAVERHTFETVDLATQETIVLARRRLLHAVSYSHTNVFGI